jgi:hypothetical protein
MRKYLFILLLGLFFINPVFGEIVAKTSNQYNDYYNMNPVMNNILSESILIIPKDVLNNVSSIDSITFTCSKNTTNPPTNNLIIRLFKYYGFGVFSQLDNTYITPSQCIDFAYQIHWNLFYAQTIDHNYDYGLGFYSTESGNGSWEYIYLNDNFTNGYNGTAYSWLNVSTNTPIINVSVVDISGYNYIINGSSIRNVPFINIYGIREIPTPTPTPTPIETPIITNNSLGIPLNNSTNSNDLYNISNNPNGLNEISIGNGTGETVGSITDKINASSLGYTVFGFIIFIIRFFNIKEDVN